MPTPDASFRKETHKHTKEQRHAAVAVDDVNHDGYADLACQSVDTATWQEGTAPTVPTGNLKEELGAVALEGADEIRGGPMIVDAPESVHRHDSRARPVRQSSHSR